MKTKKCLVVGAGFAGAVYARVLAEHGVPVLVIDRRPHIAGNCYDEVTKDGVRVHRYGPHLFHTNNSNVVAWLLRFSEFVPYEHRVEAEISDGRCLPMPVNRQTINAVFGTKWQTADEVRDFLAAQAEPRPRIENAFDHLVSHIGRYLTDLFFAPYTRKMWGMELEELDAAIVKRLPLRYDDDDRYFPGDKYQIMPENGYTAIFEAMLDHPLISVQLNQSFDHGMLADYTHCFNSMPIDEFFGSDEGSLPYRSIRFYSESKPTAYQRGRAVQVNFTDGGPLTRETDWSRLPRHHVQDTGRKTITREEPCDYRDNNFERYYPIKDRDGRYDLIYRRYRDRAQKLGKVTFIGRCGTYQYLDMHQVINQSLMGATNWLQAH